MKLAQIAIVGVILTTGAVAAAQEPRFDSIYAKAPTPELLKDLQDQLASAPKTSGLDRLHRVDLAVRAIQVDLLLGEQGTKKYADATIRPALAVEALDALQSLDAKSLNDLKSPDTRRVIWDAISFAHPAYHLYVEAVRLAGHDDDQEILERTLKPLLSSWSRGNASRPVREFREPLGNWGRDVLCDCLRVSAIRDAEGALRLTAGLKTTPESMMKRTETPGAPTVLSTRAFPLLRSAGKISEFDRALQRAAALQRAGLDVTVWSVAAERTVDPKTKTINQQAIIIYPEQPGKQAMIAIGADEALAKLGGEETLPTVYRFADPAKLDDYLTRRVQFRVIMSEVLDANAKPIAWANAIQKFLMTRTGAASPREMLIDLSYLDPWAGFTTAASNSLADAAQPAFVKILDAHSIRLVIVKVKDEQVEPAILIRNPNDRDADLILPRHEAMVGRAAQTLPAKFFDGIKTITLQSEPIREKISTSTAKGKTLVAREAVTPIDGRGWSNRFMLAKPDFAVCIHELPHSWALARSEDFNVGDWKGTVVDAFNEISWERKDGKWTIRGGAARGDDFARAYGGTNEREDIAVEAEHYVVHGRELRDQVWAQMKRGNLAPAAKYLFIKTVAFLDSDGKCIEYGIDAGDPPFTRGEFDKAIKAIEARRPLNDEQKRVRDLVARFFAISEEMLKSGRIVRR